MKETISKNEKEFVLNGIDKFQRIDGRRVNDMRSIKIQFGKQYGMVEVQLGNTRVFTAITCDIVEPKPERPNEGFYVFNTDVSPMSSVAVDASRASPVESELGRIIEKGLKESRAIDTEALCIISGSKVWSIKTSIHILDDCGNLLDCASVAVIAALLHFRKPDVTVVGNEATVHSVLEREPVPLSIHHTPISITFAFFPNEIMIVDPDTKEECVMDGKISFLVNIHKEICGISKGGGTSTSIEQVLKCSKIAVLKAAEITQQIREALHENMKSRQVVSVKRPSVGSTAATLEMIEHTRPIQKQIIQNLINNENIDIDMKPTIKQQQQPIIIKQEKDDIVMNELLSEKKPLSGWDDDKQQDDIEMKNVEIKQEDNVQNTTTTTIKKEPTESETTTEISKPTKKPAKTVIKKKVIKKSASVDSDSEEETTVVLSTVNNNNNNTTSKVYKEEEESEDLSVALKKKKPAAKKPAAKK